MKKRGTEKMRLLFSKKWFVLVGVAVVLCSLFLVALPCIAAEQNQTMLSEVTTASEEDNTLDIYGNANLDDEIDMRDFTYTARIICWLEEETKLADANFDGKIDVGDMTQIGLIILGRESELTVVDSVDRIVTVNKPVERLVVFTYPVAEAIKIVKAEERVRGVSRDIAGKKTFFPELSTLPSAGEASSPDIEKILELDPDIVCTGRLLGTSDGLEDNLPAAIALLRWDMGRLEMMKNNVKKLGYILDTEEDAELFCDFYQDYIDETIKARVAEIPDDEKKRVFVEHFKDYHAFVTGSAGHEVCEAAGGINIAADLPHMSERPIVEVDKEWLIEENPEVVVKTVLCKPGVCGYEADDATELKEMRVEIMNRSGWEVMTAVKNDRVYLVDQDLVGSTANFVSATYMAKWLYPELFDGLDPKAIHQEYLTRFQRLDYDLDEHGVFVYHPEQEGE
jgi:iron complex transport system substrate-binding protein